MTSPTSGIYNSIMGAYSSPLGFVKEIPEGSGELYATLMRDLSKLKRG
jgi:hypothetical protein